MIKYNVIGIMSGTSLDGVDIALCSFKHDNDNKWSFSINAAMTYEYDKVWMKRLGNAHKLNAIGIITLHKDYGHFLGQLINLFLKSEIVNPKSEINFIACHGHTIFHQPSIGITFQAGDGAAIAAETGLMVICDFRSLDVALGGQGAPLVPIGDRLLFPDYCFCINLGGFANISFDNAGKRTGFDICPCNIILNRLANQSGLPFDDKGQIASSGKINTELLNKLNNLFNIQHSAFNIHSLSREWLHDHFIPVINKFHIPIPDKLRTVTEFIALKITNVLWQFSKSLNQKILITGGGAYNDFLITRIRYLTPLQIFIPDKNTIDFKESLIFAFLGLLRLRNQVNCLKSVTGASKDNIGGAIFA